MFSTTAMVLCFNHLRIHENRCIIEYKRNGKEQLSWGLTAAFIWSQSNSDSPHALASTRDLLFHLVVWCGIKMVHSIPYILLFESRYTECLSINLFSSKLRHSNLFLPAMLYKLQAITVLFEDRVFCLIMH